MSRAAMNLYWSGLSRPSWRKLAIAVQNAIDTPRANALSLLGYSYVLVAQGLNLVSGLQHPQQGEPCLIDYRNVSIKLFKTVQ